MMGRTSSALALMGHGSGEARRRGSGRLRVAANDSTSTTTVADDYYEVLGLVMLQNFIWISLVPKKMVVK